MKRYFLLPVILLLVAGPAAAAGTGREGSITVGAFVDSGVADALVSEHLYLHGGVSLVLTEGLALDLPVTVVFNRNTATPAEDYIVLDFGMLLKYYPGDLGFWTGITLFQGVNFIGEKQPEQQYHYMSEIDIGYTFRWPSGFYIEPAVIFRDPLHTFRDSLEYINEYSQGYDEIRIALNFGWLFWEVG